MRKITSLKLFVGCSMIIFLGCNKNKIGTANNLEDSLMDSLCFYKPMYLDSFVHIANEIHRQYLNRSDLPKEWTSSSICQRIIAWQVQSNELNKDPFENTILVENECLNRYGLKINNHRSIKQNLGQLSTFIIKTDLAFLSPEDFILSTNKTEWNSLCQKYKKPLEKCKNQYFRAKENKKEGYDCYFYSNFLVLRSLNSNIEGFYIAIGPRANDPCQPLDLIIQYEFKQLDRGLQICRKMINPYILIEEIPVL